MTIREIKTDKKKYLSLLLLADEQENMIDCYLENGRALVEFIEEKYKKEYSILQVGTGYSPLTSPSYEKCGFLRSHRIENFFLEHYDRPIYEEGVQLKDMIYLRKKLMKQEDVGDEYSS